MLATATRTKPFVWMKLLVTSLVFTDKMGRFPEKSPKKEYRNIGLTQQ